LLAAELLALPTVQFEASSKTELFAPVVNAGVVEA